VLIVDDREANRSLLRRKLPRLGVRVSEAGDSLEALKILAAHDVDAVCIDVDMPRLNGLELDQVFAPFDALLERHGLEKIKTVGAAYLVAGGVPEPHPDPLAACAGLGLDIVTSRSPWQTGSVSRLEARSS
jgi:adenylate cyclase